MLRLATAQAAGGMGRRAAGKLDALHRQLHVPVQAARAAAESQAVQSQADHELVVYLSDFDVGKRKLRLDAFLSARLPSASRGRLQASIKEGLVAVNGRPQPKASHGVKPGDVVACSVLPPPPLEAAPEPLPLNIVYEDEHLIVLNKAADMVMHPSPGHYTGTLVNALLHHCQLPAMQLREGAAAPLSLEGAAAATAGTAAAADEAAAGGGGRGGGGSSADGQHPQLVREVAEEADATRGPAVQQQQQQQQQQQRQQPLGRAAALGALLQQQSAGSNDGGVSEGVVGAQDGDAEGDVEEEEEDDESGGFLLVGPPGTAGGSTIRPGIVHRLDKGTTGLLVVAKTDAAHLSLAQQFKDRTVNRTYQAITLGVPRPPQGRVATNVGRDLRDRKKMASYAYACARGRTAASNYSLLEVLAGGGAALVQWRLETGRTHQIRVHAKHIGHPLLADDTYSSTAAASSIVGAGKPPRAAAAQAAVRALGRPALHAKTLGFVHPATGEHMQFDSELPADLVATLEALRGPPFVAV